MTKPICIVAGMPRAATTYLYHVLAMHPRAFVPARKEMEFYSMNYHRGVQWYQDFFDQCKPDETGFDISPLYFFAPDALSRITDAKQGGKVIVLVRKPSEFLISFYKNRLVGDPNCPDFETFLSSYNYNKDGATLPLSFPPGKIPEIIENFRGALGEDLLLVDYDAIKDNPLACVQEIERFSGIGRFFTKENLDTEKINASEQQASKLVYYLMHKKWFVDTVIRLVPKSMILKVRMRLQKATRKKPLMDAQRELELESILRQQYCADDEYVSQLFSAQHSVLSSRSA